MCRMGRCANKEPRFIVEVMRSGRNAPVLNADV